MYTLLFLSSLILCSFALKQPLNIDGYIKCPSGYTARKIDVFILNAKRPADVLYKYTEENDDEFCVSTTAVDHKKTPSTLLKVDYKCQMLSKVCTYSKMMKVPPLTMLKGHPFETTIIANDKDKVACGRVRPSAPQRETFLMFSHP